MKIITASSFSLTSTLKLSLQAEASVVLVTYSPDSSSSVGGGDSSGVLGIFRLLAF